MFKKANLLIITVLLLGFAGCTPAGSEPDFDPTNEPAEQVGTEAIAAARQLLAGFLGIAPDTLQLEKIEDAEWSDSCLGLGGAAESCAAVVTPGYLIGFTADNSSYVVRTDLDGSTARLEIGVEAMPAGDDLPPAVTAALAALAQELGVTSGDIQLVNFEQREWSDSCLGLGGPAEICAAVLTPGWVVMLEVEGQPYEVRTDFAGEQVRIADEAATEPAGAQPGPDLNGAVIFFERSGGLDGQLLTVRVYGDGTVERAQGKPSIEMPVETTIVETTAVETLLSELHSAGYFGLERTYLPEDSCCDRRFYLIGVEGTEGVQFVEALEATDDPPAALWQSIELIETFIDDSFSS